MEFNRPRTRFRDNEALVKRWREMKASQTESGGKRSSNSSKTGILGTSSNSVEIRVIEDKGNDTLDSDRLKLKKIEKNKGGMKRKIGDLMEPCRNPRGKSKSSGRIRKKRNVDPVNVGNDINEDDLDVIPLSDDSEDKDRPEQNTRVLKSGRMYRTRSKVADHIVNEGKSQDISRGSSFEGVVNPKKSKEFSSKDKGNKNVAEFSNDDESDDDVKIISVNDSSMVPSLCSSSGKNPFTGVPDCNTSQFKEKCGLTSPNQQIERCGSSKHSGWKFDWVADQDLEQMLIKKKETEVKKPVAISNSFKESSETKMMASSDSGESMYEEKEESSSSDEVTSSDEDTRPTDSFVASHDLSSNAKVKSRIDRKKEATREAIGVAERIHQRSCKISTKISKPEMDTNMMGTFSCPLTLSDDEDEDVDSEEKTVSDIEMENKGKKKVELARKNMAGIAMSIDKVKVGEVTSATDGVRDNGMDYCKYTKKESIKRGRGRPRKNPHRAPISVKKILVDSIWEKGGTQLEKLVHTEENPPVEATLPVKFSFEDSDTEIVEKSDFDVEVEKLFQEMEYVMGLLKVGYSDAAMVDSEENTPSNTRKDPDCGCLDGGNHHLVLDEQIGLRCTICQYVMQEIRNILPNFCKHQGGRGEARYYDRVDYSNFDGIQIEDFTASELPAYKRQVQDEGTVWDLVPGIRYGIYPHQEEGFEFIWKNIAGSIIIEEAKKFTSNGEGLGCIISHAPGTGKTRLTIMFLQTYLQLNPDCLPVIIAPCSMLLTWEEEFRKWNVGIPFHNLNSYEYSGKESASAINLLKNDRQHGNNDVASMRLVKLFSWKNEKSVLGISYQLFEELANVNILVEGGNKRKVKGNKDNDIAAQVRKMLLELPGLLILDEGHIPRNGESQIWKVLSEVQTKRRIMLSGTPFQNNFEELLNTFRVVRPKFIDDIISQTQGSNSMQKSRRIKKAKEKWALLTNNIGEDNDQKLDELKSMISEFVHVYKGTILKEKLPGLRDNVIVLSPTDLQKDLMEIVQERNFFKRQHLQSLISVHPSLLSTDDLSEKESLLVGKYELENLKLYPDVGVKTKFLTELIRLSWALKERVLVFSQFIKPLKFIMKQLENHFNWTSGKEILFMGGEICEKERQSSINLLNDPESEVRVMLASSRACSEGINLIGASRVVLLDVVWNPSMKRQSISRAYRLGQKKVVHVYLLLSGTWECKKYKRQAGKDRIAELIFSPKDSSDKPETSLFVAEDNILQDMVQHKSMGKIFDKIIDPKEPDFIDTFG